MQVVRTNRELPTCFEVDWRFWISLEHPTKALPYVVVRIASAVCKLFGENTGLQFPNEVTKVVCEKMGDVLARASWSSVSNNHHNVAFKLVGKFEDAGQGMMAEGMMLDLERTAKDLEERVKRVLTDRFWESWWLDVGPTKLLRKIVDAATTDGSFLLQATLAHTVKFGAEETVRALRVLDAERVLPHLLRKKGRYDVFQ